MFLRTNYNPEFEKMKKIRYVKGFKSVDKMITSKKINLSKMDEELSILNSDIDNLYKKYSEKKKIRRKKEKSEQHLISRINFLIDEERKIRNQIENKSLPNEENKIKKKYLKIFNSPETIRSTGILRYKTIESNDDNERNGICRIKNILRKKENNNNKTLSSNNSAQNNTNENLSNNNDYKEYKDINNNKNIIPLRSNVTNNVCIIINNTERNNINIEDNKKKIKYEIQNIKLKLASKIKSLDKETNSLNNGENINTSSFNRKKRLNKVNKNGIRSLKNILNLKRKYLKNLNNEIDLRRININIKKRSGENIKKNTLFNTNENNNKRNIYKSTNKDKSKNKRNYSKSDNSTNTEKDKNKSKNSNSKRTTKKSQLKNKIHLFPNDKNISIDSNEIILTDAYINSNNNRTNTEDINKKNKEISEKINGKSSSSKKEIPLSNITFHQSIENKRKMLGIGLNINSSKEKKQNDIIYQKKNKNILKIKYTKKNQEKNDNNNDDTNSYDILSYPSNSNATMNYNNIRNNFSLMSIFSNKSNKTNIQTKQKYYNNIENNNNTNAHFIKIRNINNNDIIIKKQEKNKNYVNSIRIIKKREKNNILNNDINNNPINKINKEDNKKEKEIKEKKRLYENELTVTKELAAIRRLNMKIKEYKNYKPQIQKISQRRKNRFQEEKKMNDENNCDNNINENNNKGKKYRFKSYGKLSEIQRRTNDSLNKKNNTDKNQKIRSKSNKSFNELHNKNNIHSYKFS